MPPGAKSPSGAESGGGSSAETGHVAGQGGEAGATILGINTESRALSIVALALSLLLGAAVWLRASGRVLLAGVAGFGLVFAAGDGRELVHQLNESNGGLAAIAIVLLALHLTIAVLAAVLVARTMRPGSAPAADVAS